MNNKNKIFTLITIFAISIVFLVGCGDNDEKHNSKNEESLSDVETTTIEKETPETTTCTEETTIVKETTTVTEETTKKEEPQTTVGTEFEKSGVTNYSNMYDAAILEKINELRFIFPANKYWNHHNTSATGEYNVYDVTDIPCNNDAERCSFCNVYKGVTNTVMPHPVRGTQCLGFASLCSDYIFGADENIRVYYDFNEIQIGDQARINNYHSVLVIDKTDNDIVVADCNSDYKTCIIKWDRRITKEELLACKSWYMSRRPVK